MSVSYFNTNEYELMNKDNIVATVTVSYFNTNEYELMNKNNIKNVSIIF